eukprot:CAMPEP_0181313086 /NCGR_PEP_ID=MMETSP1101-20121128/14057_1 /TAXON_ID=46948 /ORGANISM="Rhodomonas abbreviata, Strain Caron Lab Isolate" /LENGTH=267 /DNA_ID=CAMNT_0023420009 /DNA_START=125 /DNA_END=926 /DNA_ORIENTATION=-
MTRILSRHSSAPKAAAVAKSHSQQKEVQRTVTGQEIWTGYFTERSRPNADCSGVVTQMFGIALGTCWTTPTGGSYKYGCESSGRNVELKAQSYFSNDCSGSPNGLAINGEFSGDQCHMNLDNVNKTGFEMIGLACESNPMSHLDHSGGLKTFHFDSQCMDAPYQYVIMRGDACMLDMDTGDGDMLTDESEFTYIMYTDGNDNAIEVTASPTPPADAHCGEAGCRILTSGRTVCAAQMEKAIPSSSVRVARNHRDRLVLWQADMLRQG